VSAAGLKTAMAHSNADGMVPMIFGFDACGGREIFRQKNEG